MSIDRFYAQVDCKWKRLDDIDLQRSQTDFWVDLSHGANAMVDERYFFQELASALEFYLTGWEQRQLMDNDDQPCGLNDAGLYSRGRLIHGRSIHGDEIGHERTRLREIVNGLCRSLAETGEL